jgi:hypothetical protein
MSALEPFRLEPRWVAWVSETPPDRNEPTKVPYGAGGGKAMANKSTTWITRSQAEKLAQVKVNGAGGGIGIELGDLGNGFYLCGADLDSCIAQASGLVAAWADAILELLETYHEFSPGGFGIKALFQIAAEDVRRFLDLVGVAPEMWGAKRGIPGHNGGKHGPGVEIYTAGRFFAVTERRVDGSPEMIATLDWPTLERLAALIPAKQEPQKATATGRDSSRSGLALAVAGKVYRAGGTFEQFCDTVRTDPGTGEWAREKGDERQLRRSWEKAERDAQAQKPRPDDSIGALNRTYAVIRVVNRAAILNEHLDPEGNPAFSLLAPDSFRLLLANQKIEIETKDKEGLPVVKPVPIANIWLAHPKRRQFEGITFAPQGAPPGYFNLWGGLPLKPSAEGSCQRFKAHLLDNVCNGDGALYNWVFGWFADIFQHPARKCGTSLALRGEMGTGKTIVGKTFGRLLGLHYVPVSDARYITGRFNAHLVRCLLLFADEAFWAGDRAAEGKLRDLVTGDQHPIELKGFEVFFVPNYVRLFICGDRDWLVPAGLGERRFATLDVADTRKEDTAYFAAIADELDAGGYQRLLYELFQFDVAAVDLRHIPKTEALLDQKIASLSPEDGWWFDVLKRGHLPHRTKDAQPGCCPGMLLYDDYIEHAQKQGARRRHIETAVGIFLNRTAPIRSACVETFTVRDGTTFEPKIDGRGTVYRFNSLAECRQAFEEKIHQPITWPDATDWMTP